MNKMERSPAPDPDAKTERIETTAPTRSGNGRMLAVGVVVLIAAALAVGIWQHYSVHAQVMAAAEQSRDFVPTVTTATVNASSKTMSVTWPGTTEAFAQANIYARASGYVSKREVDIGSRVKAGQLLLEITAPELDHQIVQAEATLTEMQAALQQAQANRDLGQVTWNRDSVLVQKGSVTAEQGDTDRLNLKAQEAAAAVAQANIKAQTAQIAVLHQQKDYQSVTAPFDGVITQRNVDVGSLVQADAASGTFLFTLMQSDMLRIQIYVPQDEAFGVKPGVDAVIRVPELPGRDFPGKVTLIADALQPGTRTLLTEIDLPNPDDALSPGIYCNVELKIPRKTPSLVLPSEAIIFNAKGLSVAVVEDGTAHLHNVNVVRDFGTTIEVNSGVKDGDQVILAPPLDLADGQKVRVRTKPPT